MRSDQDMIVSEALAEFDGYYKHGGADDTIAAAKLLAETVRDALRPKEAGQAGDWVLVPREPTGKMLLAPDAPRWGQYRTHEKQAVYAAMLAAAPPPPASPAVTANCCNCGRIIDTRERADGGDSFGCQLDDGRWTCSIACYDVLSPFEIASPAVTVGVKPAVWHDIGYLMSIIDSAIEGGFDPDEDGPILDHIRAEVDAGLHFIPALSALKETGK